MAFEHRFLKIVVTGPESSGKTAIADALAQVLATNRVPEFARCYLTHLGRPYHRGDLKRIGAGQSAWERWYADRLPLGRNAGILLCDTDWTVLQIWEQFRFGIRPDYEWPRGYGAPVNADLYLLCAPDIPWSPDPLREHPEARDVLFGLYEQLLKERQARFVTLHGLHEVRLETALAAIRKLL